MHKSTPDHEIEVKTVFALTQEGDKGDKTFEQTMYGFDMCVSYFGRDWPENIRMAAVNLGCRLTNMDCTAYVTIGELKTNFKVRFTTMSCMTRMSDQVMAILIDNS